MQSGRVVRKLSFCLCCEKKKYYVLNLLIFQSSRWSKCSRQSTKYFSRHSTKHTLFLRPTLICYRIVTCFDRVFRDDFFCKILSDAGLSSNKIKRLKQMNYWLSKYLLISYLFIHIRYIPQIFYFLLQTVTYTTSQRTPKKDNLVSGKK